MSGSSSEGKRVIIARVGAPHGVRGEVRLWPYAEEPGAIARYGALETVDGARSFEIIHLRAAKRHLVARFKGIDSRDQAERLNGLELCVPRQRLPEPGREEFYYADLIGLAAELADGSVLGRVVGVHNFGAGDMLEIAPLRGGSTWLVPFTRSAVPRVDMAAGRIVIDPPREVSGEAEQAEET